MANKKIVYIIVEGPSDELVLGSLFEELNSLKRNTNINHSFPIPIKDDNGN